MIIPVIVGPTAVGKTSLSVELAKKIDGEIISIDSMQIYKYMDIGTAKITKKEMQQIPHHMIDIKMPHERFSVAEYVKSVKQIIQEIIEKGKRPIIIGGTGLYVNALIYNYNFEQIDEEKLIEYREMLDTKIEKGETTLEELYEKAIKIDEAQKDVLDKTNKKRIYRILEMFEFSKMNKTEMDKTRIPEQENKIGYFVDKNGEKHKYQLYFLEMEREKLYERINKRIDIMLEQGLIEEVEKILNIIKESILKENKENKENLEKYAEIEKKQEITSLQAIGYKEVVKYLNKEITKDEMITELKKNTRHYAKRQITWFKKNEKKILNKDKYTEQEILEKILKEI